MGEGTSPSILQAIATGVAVTTVSGVVAYVGTMMRRSMNFRPTGGRRKALTGRWKGSARQHSSKNELVEFEATFDIRAGRRRIDGTAIIAGVVGEQRFEQKLRFIDGGFMHDQFMKLDYVNQENHVRQFGTIIGQLSSSGDEIHATYAGYGSVLNEPSTGRTILRKVPFT